MKKIYIVLFTFFGMIGAIQSQSFYDINTINTVEITFQESNWDYLLDQLVSAGQEGRLLGTVTINGQVYDSVGVRYKGNSSYSSNQVKNPFNIKLDYVIDDQKIEGYGTLKLANGFKDPSLVRETVSYEIARKYFPASLSNYANVYVNGTLLGIYTNDQDVDKYFMRTNFSSDENVRFKGEISDSGQPTGGVWEYFGTDSTDYYDYYAIESDYGWDQLIDFIDTLNNHNTYVDQVLNIDRHLWFLAFSNLLVNLDGPINNPQNHYIYKDDNGRMNPIPWDLNESFGVFASHQTLGQLGTTQLQQLSPFANLNESEFPIISKVLTNTTYRRMYVAHMKTIMAENFSSGLYLTRALEIQDIIDADVQADGNKFYTYSDFTNNIYNSVGGGGWPPSSSVIGISQLMSARISYLSGLSDFTATAPQISNISYIPQQVSPNTTVWFNAQVSSATQVYLGYRYSLTEKFVKTQMFDDGNHQDGSAGDGVFGVSIMAGHTDMQYYIYADNGNASSFSPVRAEYEFYSITITSDLVINEFMADNETTVADPAGEYDDWIELYNNGQSDINLNGYFMSDDAADLNQWNFPDTTIASGAYLVVWADNDEDQEGLHANFKLSASGESIFLCDAGLSIIDEVNFGQQKVDTTTGRYPNGTGAFMELSPTFGAYNELWGGIQYNDVVINEFLADNQTIEPDQNGEYDGWIELYNNGIADLPLEGMYLSNDPLIPAMWSLPAVTIPAGGYLIVWADNDIGQQGLHANFELSNVGGTILLLDPDMDLMDEVSYEQQITDISTGRFPNGIGYFMEMTPTYNAENFVTNNVNYDDLVINEFMAANATTVPDQDGEYDDWIELYNNGAVELPLLGLYLSDDTDVPGQWAFPDTTIGAHDYLIVWADNDEEQEGLHTNFKLSASGESVVIADIGWNIIDETDYGNQTDDISYGRFPNGTGSFSEMPPTYAAENEIYCDYCISTYSNTTDDWISNVTFNSINNSSGQGGTDSYEDYTNVSTDVEPGQTYPISITFTMNGNWHQDCFAFIDWNRDCDFDDANESFNLGDQVNSGTLSSSITVPVDATPGSMRMRIVEQYNQDPEACDTHPTVYGETEDYSINILNEDIVLDMKVFLEGPFGATNMSIGLSDIPFDQPYDISPWNYSGAESVTSIPNNVVDWVLVELRDAPNAVSAISASVVGRQAAFILTDGSVVDLDGASNLLFTNDISQQLFVVVYHRNHIAVMSNYPLTGVSGIYAYDFFSGQDQAYGGITGHKEIASGIWGMVCGDGDANNDIDTFDISNVWMIQAGLEGYLESDYNMDGNANNIDKDDSWLPNKGFGGQVPD